MTPELLAQIAELLGQTAEEITALSLEDVADLLVAAFDEGEAPEEGADVDLERLKAIAEASKGVQAAILAAETAEAAQAAEIEALRAEVHPVVDETAVPEGDEDEETAPEPEPATPEVVQEAEQVVADAPVPVAASVPMRRRRPATHAPVVQHNDGDGPIITASASLPNRPAGSRLTSLEDVGAAFASLVDGYRSSGDGKAPVARFQYEWPEDRILGPDPRRNAELIEAVNAPRAIHAAGGLCAPVAIRYEMENSSVAARPVRDALVNFNAARGGIQVPSGVLLTAPDAGVGIVTEAQDTSDTTKPCVVITCPTYSEVDISAIYQCLTIGNFSARTFPELFRVWWAKATALHARKAEGALLDAIGDATTTLDTVDGQNLSAARDVIEAIIRAVAEQRSRHRAYDVSFRVLAPIWLRDMMRADLARGPALDTGMVVLLNSQIDSLFTAAGVNVTWYLDTETGSGQVYGAQLDGNALNPWNLNPIVYIFREGSWLFLDGGVLDLGMEIRDSALNLHNNVNAFTETFENAAFVGDIPTIKLTYSLCVSGASSLPVVVTCPENS